MLNEFYRNFACIFRNRRCVMNDRTMKIGKIAETEGTPIDMKQNISTPIWIRKIFPQDGC